jgi:hypothetical protein
MYDDLLGTAITDDEGHFEVVYTERDFRELFDKTPDVYLYVYAPPWRLLIETTDSVRWGASEHEHYELEIDRETLGDMAPTRPDDEVVLDASARRVWVGGMEVSLRRKEFDLLAYLYGNRGRACSRDEISKMVWADEGGIISEETIGSTMHRLRQKIEPAPSNPCHLITVPRYGYRLDL